MVERKIESPSVKSNKRSKKRVETKSTVHHVGHT